MGVFLTARPTFFEERTRVSMNKRYGVDVTVLGGHLSDSLLVPFASNVSNRLISDRKFGNFVRYATMYPECKFVWFGDSGQGDIATAKRMMETGPDVPEAARGRVVAAFIQDVSDDDGLQLKTTVAERTQLGYRRIYVVDNYLEAAVIACKQLEIISAPALRQVAATARQQ